MAAPLAKVRRDGGPNDQVPAEVAHQVLESGRREVASRLPGERAFGGTVPTDP